MLNTDTTFSHAFPISSGLSPMYGTYEYRKSVSWGGEDG